jgi:transcriptional antiterminator NusG
MKKDWFVLQALTGQENKVQKSIVARTKLEAMGDYVGECIIPTEKVTEKKNGKSRTVVKKFFPGYVLCELALYDDSKGADATGKKAIYERTWQFLRETPGLIGFVGGERPMPLKQSEVDAILSSGKGAGKAEPPPRPKVLFNVNDTVKVTDGPFQGQVGQVSIVDPKGKLTVEVQIFSRKTPVDVEYWQVEKMSEEEILASNPAV